MPYFETLPPKTTVQKDKFVTTRTHKKSKKMRWKPKDNCRYWFLYGDGNIGKGRRTNSLTDQSYYRFGAIFRTKKEAQQAAKLVKKTLIDFHRRKG